MSGAEVGRRLEDQRLRPPASWPTRWERHGKRSKRRKPAPPKPIDYPAVEAAVTRYAADRTTVKLHLMWKALVAEVPVLGDGAAVQAGDVVRYVFGCLRRLGFKGSSSGKSWRRK